MKLFRVFLVFLLSFSFVCGLSSCGQSGPLYLPDSPKAHATQPGKKPAYGQSSFLIGMSHPAGVNSRGA